MSKILYFGAESCGVCKALRPQVEELCKAKGVDFEYLNADDEEIADKYHVRSIPMMLYYEIPDEAVPSIYTAGTWKNLKERLSYAKEFTTGIYEHGEQ